jgi:protein-disulfide isomerase
MSAVRVSPEPARISPNALSLLLVTSVAESLLSLYQWMELLLVRAGGTAVCALNETVNCATVWNSDFASRLHASLGMPVAALGLVWGLTGFGVSVALARKVAAGSDSTGLSAAAKVWGAIGALCCVTFGVASLKLGSVCLTCLGTYALTVGFALTALALLPGGFPKAALLRPAAIWLVAIGLPIFLILLWPGRLTPKATGAALADRPREQEVEKFFETLPWAESQATADARAQWKNSPVPDVSAFSSHQRYGPANAPVKITEFTDILCSHCRALIANLDALKKAVPADSLAIEPRYFPLDGECNKKVAQSSGDGIRCLGAKVQICLESTPQYWSLREELFENQNALSKDKILEIASKGMPLEKLQACVADPQTQARIDEDVAYAMLFNPKGTPVVLLNGRETLPVPPFLYGMVMSKGDADAKYFAKLPPPR